jgi:cation transport ATPase
MQTNKRKAFIPILLFFILLNAFFILGKNMLAGWGADQEVLIFGNLVLFIITMLSFWLGLRGLKNANSHAFIRSIYSGMMIKMFISIIAAFIYIATYKKELNKPAFFSLMGLYLVYTFIEVSGLTKMLKQKANG